MYQKFKGIVLNAIGKIDCIPIIMKSLYFLSETSCLKMKLLLCCLGQFDFGSMTLLGKHVEQHKN